MLQQNSNTRLHFPKWSWKIEPKPLTLQEMWQNIQNLNENFSVFISVIDHSYIHLQKLYSLQMKIIFDPNWV